MKRKRIEIARRRCFLKGRQEVGDDVGRDAVSVRGRDVAEAEHQERQKKEQAARKPEMLAFLTYSSSSLRCVTILLSRPGRPEREHFIVIIVLGIPRQ